MALLKIIALCLTLPAALAPGPNNRPAPRERPVTAASETPAARSIDLRVRYGSTLGALLRQNRVKPDDVRQLIAALRTVYNPRKIKAGDVLELTYTAAGNIAALRYRPAPELAIEITRADSGAFRAVADTLPIRTETALLVGRIESSLYEAVRREGESPELTMLFSDIFQWDIDFFIEPRRGDRFAILFEKAFIRDPKTRQQRFLRYGRILAAAYLKHNAAFVAYNYPDPRGRSRFFDDQGNSFQKTFLKSPLNYRRISSRFSTNRFHPILKRRRAHRGVDFAAPRGTPVVAAADGRVIYRGWHGGHGKCIKIAHKNGRYVTLYGHLSAYAKRIKVGSHIRQNQLIGFVGATGLATGPHLHYSMYVNGKPIDPLKLRPASGKPIPAAERESFLRVRDLLRQRLGLSPDRQLLCETPVATIAR